MMSATKGKILVTPEDVKPSSRKFEILGVLNPGAVELIDGRKVLYVRVIERLKKMEDEKYFYSPRFCGKKEFKIILDRFAKSKVEGSTDIDFWFKDGTKRLAFISHLRRVFLDKTGTRVEKIDSKPTFYGIKTDAELGVEDPRITKIGEKYYMTYVGLSRAENISTYFAVSSDGLSWERKGIIFGEQDKDVVFFPELVQGKYVAFDRPEGNFSFSTPHIWIAFSKDLIYWGKLDAVELSRDSHEFSRSGAGPPPIKTPQGWLLFFHAVTKIPPSGFVCSVKRALGMYAGEDIESYAVWAALFDLENPKKIIARSYCPLFVPKGDEVKSFEDKLVIFPTGLIEQKQGKEFLVYSGAGDTSVTVHKLKRKKIMKLLRKV